MTVLLVWDSYCYFSVKDIKRGLLSPVTTQWASALQIHQTTFLLLLFCHKNAISYVYNTYDSILSYCSFPIMIWIMIWILIMNPKMPSHEATEVYVCCQLYFPLIDLRLFLESHLINTRLELHFFPGVNTLLFFNQSIQCSLNWISMFLQVPGKEQILHSVHCSSRQCFRHCVLLINLTVRVCYKMYAWLHPMALSSSVITCLSRLKNF